MAVDKLPEFAKNGQQNTDGLNLEDGFPVNLKPARQWFNFLFNKLTLSINQIIDEDYIRHNEIVDNLNAKDLNKPLSANQGRVLNEQKLNKDTEQSSYKTDKGFLDKYASRNTPSFFFDAGDGKFFNQFTVGVASSLDSGAYFILGASPINNKVKVMSGVRRENGTYDLQKNLTLLDSESNNVVNGDFVWDNHKQGGWARGLVYKAKSDSTTYAGFGAFGGTDTLDKIYMAIGGDNVWPNGNGKGIWIDQNGAYSNCKWTLDHGIRVSSFGLGFKFLAKGIAGDNDTGWIGVGADQLNSGYLEIGTGGDGTEPIFVRQYNSNTIQDGEVRNSLKNELILLDYNGDTKTSKNIHASSFVSTRDEATMHSTSGRYLFINSNRWGSFSPASGYIPLSVDCGGTGNGQGIAPSASKLQVARKINNVDFDGTQDITVRDDQKFYAMGITGESREYPAWNSKTGVYQKTNDGDSLQVIQFLGSGSTPAVQLMARYANNGLFYRSARDGLGFERDFDRIVTENGGTATQATKLLNARKIFGQNFDGTNDIAGNLTADTGMLLTDSYHYIDMGRAGLDRMNFNVYGGVFNFINAQNGSIVARLNSNGIDCNAATASRLQTSRKINDINFDGTGDINIAAPMRYLGAVNSSTLNNTNSDGFYLVTGASILGLYDYGVLEVRSSGGTIHQTYFAHLKNSNGSVAVRQSWGGSNNFTAWRSLDPQGSWSMTQNGYKIHPDGYVEQWGYISGDKEETIKTAYFPISFPTQCLNIQVSRMSLYRTSSFTDGDGGALIVDGSITNSSFVFSQQVFNSNSTGSLGGVMWRAVGY